MQWRDDTTLPSRGLCLRPIGKSERQFPRPSYRLTASALSPRHARLRAEAQPQRQ
jgi:hypothetical protein